MSWSKLPQEIRDQILDCLYDSTKHDRELLSYRATCKAWNDFVESRQMISVHLNEETTDDFCQHIAANKKSFHYVRRITMDISSRKVFYPFDLRVLDHPAVMRPLWTLLDLLADMSSDADSGDAAAAPPHPGIVLQLKLQDKAARSSDMDVLGAAWPYLDNRDCGLERALLGPLRSNSVVKVCQIDHYVLQALTASRVQQILSSCTQLAIYRLSQSRSYAYRDQIDQCHSRAEFNYKQMLHVKRPASVNTLVMYCDETFQDADPALGALAAQAAVDLQHVSIAYVADAMDFFQGGDSHYSWPHLRTLTLTSATLASGGSDDDLEPLHDLLLLASRAAARMPQLRELEIHGATCAFTAMFRVTTDPPMLLLEADWRQEEDEKEEKTPRVLTPRIVAAWEAALSREFAAGAVTERRPAAAAALRRTMAMETRSMTSADLGSALAAAYTHYGLVRQLSTAGHWYRRTPHRQMFDEARQQRRRLRRSQFQSMGGGMWARIVPSMW